MNAEFNKFFVNSVNESQQSIAILETPTMSQQNIVCADSPNAESNLELIKYVLF